MKQFQNVVMEIKRTLFGMTMFFIFLDSVIIFLILYLILALFGYPTWYSFLPAAAYFAYQIYKEQRTNQMMIVERYYPSLNEKLRTAADYSNVENEIVDELHRQVIDGLRGVAASSFFNRRETFIKVTAIVLICFTIIGLTILNINFIGVRDKLSDAVGSILGGGEEVPAGTERGDVLEQTRAGGAAFSDIYGKKSVAKLGGKEVEVELRPSAYEFVIRESNEEEQPEEFSEQFPTDVTGVESKNYVEKIPIEKDKQEIIKKYFKKLTEG